MTTLRVLIADDSFERAFEYARLVMQRNPQLPPGEDIIQTQVGIAISVDDALRRLIKARNDGAPFDVLVTDFFFDASKQDTALGLISQLAPNGFTSANLGIVLVSREMEANLFADQIENASNEWRGVRGQGVVTILKGAISQEERFLEAVFASLWRRLDEMASFASLENGDVVPPGSVHSDFLTANPPLRREVDNLLRSWAPQNLPILIIGETGTGKEVLARSIHQASGRAQRGRFLALNIAALPAELRTNELFGHEVGAFTSAIKRQAGVVELANGGTLFLDEIQELPPDGQIMLLRVLQEKTFNRLGSAEDIRSDFRLIAGTNRDLDDDVGARRFRSDLKYRIDVKRAVLPSLEKRPEDIRFFADLYWRTLTDGVPGRGELWEDDAFRALHQHTWPGNVRELRMTILKLKIDTAPGKTVSRSAVEAAMSGKPAFAPGLFNLRTPWQRQQHVLFFPLAEDAARRAPNKSDAIRLIVDGVYRSQPLLFGDFESDAKETIKDAWRTHRETCPECERRWSLRWH